MYRYVTNPDSTDWISGKIVRVQSAFVWFTLMKAIPVFFWWSGKKEPLLETAGFHGAVAVHGTRCFVAKRIRMTVPLALSRGMSVLIPDVRYAASGRPATAEPAGRRSA